MEPEFKDKSEKLFIAIMKVFMGIVGVFSFCYIVSALELVDWESFFPAPVTNPIVLDEHTYTKKEEEQPFEKEITQKFKEEEKVEEDDSNTLGKSIEKYGDKIDSYFNKGFYYDLYMKSQEEQKNEEKQDNRKNDRETYDQKEDTNKHEEDEPYFFDDFGFFPNLEEYGKKDTYEKYDFEEIFPWVFNW